jgi:hypothetical protein
MENGEGVAYLVTGHSSNLSFSYLSPPSLPTSLWDQLPTGVSFVHCDQFGAGCEGVSGAIVSRWWSFELQPFSIVILVFIVAYLINLLKLCK